MKSVRTTLAAAVLFAAVAATGALAQDTCAPDVVKLRGGGLNASFTVEIADTVAERSRGLMFRRAMPRGAGMLFVYERPQSVSFWMKNTFIPLDLVFLDAEGVVKHVHANAVPQDLTPIPGGSDILAVLEINAGLARAMGIVPGVQMQHPAFGGAAKWPC